MNALISVVALALLASIVSLISLPFRMWANRKRSKELGAQLHTIEIAVRKLDTLEQNLSDLRRRMSQLDALVSSATVKPTVADEPKRESSSPSVLMSPDMAALDKNGSEPSMAERTIAAASETAEDISVGQSEHVPAERDTEPALPSVQTETAAKAGTMPPSVERRLEQAEVAKVRRGLDAPLKSEVTVNLLERSRLGMPPRPKEKEPWRSKLKLGRDWEHRIGGSWLNVIGIVVLVIGIVLLLNYSLQYLGPAGKIGIGVALAVGLLTVGVLAQGSERYASFARPMVGGGWAIGYFTAYAAHNVEAARIIHEPAWALPLMSLVAVGMIVHSYRYRSQAITGLAYGLAYLAIVISPVTTFSLVAASLLGASLLAVLGAMPWYHIAMLGIAGTYTSYLLWANASLGRANGLVGEQSFWVSQVVLGFYWVLFSATAFTRRTVSEADERNLFIISIANSAAFLFLSWDLVARVRPEEMFVLTGMSGAAYAVMGFLLSRTALHLLFVLNVLMAGLLLGVTPVLAVESDALEVELLALWWAVEAAVLLGGGLRHQSLLVRLQSYLLSVLAAGALAQVNLHGSAGGRQSLIWQTVPPIIAFFFYHFERLKREAGQSGVMPAARSVGVGFGYLATVVVAAFIWQQLGATWVGLTWTATGALFVLTGVRLDRPHVRLQGAALIVLGAFASYEVNLHGPFAHAADGALWLRTVPVIAALYVLNRWLRRQTVIATWSSIDGNTSELLVYLGAALIAALIWHLLPADFAGLGWIVVGLLSFEAGKAWGGRDVRTSGYMLAVAGTLMLAVIDLTAWGNVRFGVSHSIWVSVAPAVVALYFLFFRLWCWRATGPLSESEWGEADTLAADSALFVATALLAAFLFRALPLEYVGAGWMLAGLLSFEWGRWWKERLLGHAAYLLAGAAALALGIVGLSGYVEVRTAGSFSVWLSIAPGIIGLYYLYARALGQTPDELAMPARRDIASWVAMLLAAAFCWRALDTVSVAVAWGGLALALFEVGRRLRLEPLLAQSNLLAAAVLARLFMANFTVTGTALGISHRLWSVTPIIGLYYHLRTSLRKPVEGFGQHLFEIRLSRLYSYAAALLVVVLLRFELGRAHAVMGWAPLIVVLLLAGVGRNDRDFRMQSYLLAALVGARVWATDLSLTGSFYGVPERFVTTGLAVLGLLVASLYCVRRRSVLGGNQTDHDVYGFLDRHAQILFGSLAAVLLANLLYREVAAGWLTVAWTLESFFLLSLGFAFAERSLRVLGLTLLFICLVKLVLLDMQGVETILRILSYIVLGGILLLISFGYTRYQNVVRRYL